MVIHKEVSENIAEQSIKTVEDTLKESLNKVLNMQGNMHHQRHNTMVGAPEGLSSFATEFKQLVHQKNVPNQSLKENTERLQVSCK